MAKILVLPVIRIERYDCDIDKQQLKPSSDRKNVVELHKVRIDREFARQCESLKKEEQDVG